MRQSLKIAGLVFVAIAVTAFITANFIRKATITSFSKEFSVVQAENAVSSVEAYDRIESLLVHGCNKEALEAVKIERSSLLSEIKYQMKWGAEVSKRISKRNPDVAERAMKDSSPAVSFLPQCK